MRIKISLCLAVLFLSQISMANMASPIREGTKSAAVFSSRDIDILKEKLSVTINKDFSEADYIAEYQIYSEKEGKQIPLLFFAMNYKGDFRVFVDENETSLLEIPPDFTVESDSMFNGFSNEFNTSVDNSERKVVKIQFEKNSKREYPITDLKYFEVDLTKGEHRIRVEYTANVWKDRSGWVNKYRFPYSLSPARNWRSFGEIEIVLNSREFGKNLSTNIGQPSSGNMNSIATWDFNKLPDADVFDVSYTPEINSATKAMIEIDPFGLACIAGIILALFHFIFIRNFRIRKPDKKFSWILVTGSLIIPFLIILCYIFSYDIIDGMIGNDASKYHGYTFLALAFYPIILIIYFVIMLIADIILKKKHLKTV